MEQIENLNTPEKKTDFVIEKAVAEETVEEYLSRIRNNFFKYYINNNKNYRNQDPQELKKYRHNLINKADREFSKNNQLIDTMFENLKDMESFKNTSPSKNKDAITIDKLKNALAETRVESVRESYDLDSDDRIDFFESTHRRRDFFSKGKKHNLQSHSLTLFGIPKAFQDSIESEKYFHSLLDNKNIYLFGGGDSVNDLLASEKYKPKNIINVDPHLKFENISKNKRNAYESISISAADKNLQTEIILKGLPHADEIWANYSVPCYLQSYSEIKNLIENIDSLLAINGIARIHPISIHYNIESGEDDPNQKIEAFIESIKKLMRKGNFNISIFENTLIIKKMGEESLENINSTIQEETFRKSYPETATRKKMRRLRKRLCGKVKLSEEKALIYLGLAKDLCDLEPTKFDETIRLNLTGLVKIFSENQTHNTPIQCISIASNALTGNDNLKQKDQYLKFDKIAKKLEKIFIKYNIQYIYQVILADIDYRYDLEKYNKQWELNIQNLKNKTSVPVLRLSELFPEYKIVTDEIESKKNSYFDSQIVRLENALPQFHATRERARFQMSLYSAIGKMMQKNFSTGILFDVQKKIYPYEQPFYNETRKSDPVPIIRVNNI